TSPRHVRFTPNNGHWAAHPSQHFGCRFMSTRPRCSPWGCRINPPDQKRRSKQCGARNAPRPSEALVEAAGALAEDPVEIPALLFLDDRFLLLACFHERSAAIDIGARARWSLMPARGVVLACHRRLLARTGGHAGTKLSGSRPC